MTAEASSTTLRKLSSVSFFGCRFGPAVRYQFFRQAALRLDVSKHPHGSIRSLLARHSRCAVVPQPIAEDARKQGANGSTPPTRRGGEPSPHVHIEITHVHHGHGGSIADSYSVMRQRAAILRAVIDQASPLRRLSAHLEPRQRQFLDGIRYAADMADLSYERLSATLIVVANSVRTKDQDVPSWAHAAAFQDAWSMVDSIHRLRRLLEATPGHDRGPTWQVFIRETKTIVDLRNGIQHLDRTLHTMPEDQPVWGILGWVCKGEHERQLLVSTMFAGTLRTGQLPLVNPASKTVEFPIDHVTLTAFGLALSLSTVRRQLKKLVVAIETGLKPQFDPDQAAGADLVISVTAELDLPIANEALDSTCKYCGQVIHHHNLPEKTDPDDRRMCSTGGRRYVPAHPEYLGFPGDTDLESLETWHPGRFANPSTSSPAPRPVDIHS